MKKLYEQAEIEVISFDEKMIQTIDVIPDDSDIDIPID